VGAFRELLPVLEITLESIFRIGASSKRDTRLFSLINSTVPAVYYLFFNFLADFDIEAFGVFTAASTAVVRSTGSVGQVMGDKLTEEGEPAVEARVDGVRWQSVGDES